MRGSEPQCERSINSFVQLKVAQCKLGSANSQKNQNHKAKSRNDSFEDSLMVMRLPRTPSQLTPRFRVCARFYVDRLSSGDTTLWLATGCPLSDG